MRIQFIIIGAPRSGTAWAANWLTTERTLCYHDPLFHTALEDLDSLPCDRYLGIADTGLWMYPEYLAAHPATKVILHRDIAEVNYSLRRAGLPEVAADTNRKLYTISGAHFQWTALFENPQQIWSYLFGTHVDLKRHELLCKLNVQVDFEKVDPDPEVIRRLLERMRGDVR